MRADATIPIVSARAQVSYLRDEKNVSFELMGEEDAVAFLEERSFFFKLKAFAKDFEEYSCKPGEKGRYVNLDFGHLVELSKLDKALRSLVLDLALDIEHYLKVRINAAAMRAGTDPFKVVDTFLEESAASVVSEQTKALDKSTGASAIRLATSTLERCDLESRPAIVSAANEATAAVARNQYWTAAAWLLERKYPDEYGKAERRLGGDDPTGQAPQIVLGVVARPVQQEIDFGALECGAAEDSDAPSPNTA